jgi:ABC-2 type transport system permease protein
MTAPPVISTLPESAPVLETAPSPERTLRRLFLTLFLRGRSARGLRKQSAPKSVGRKLLLTIGFYALFGLFALGFQRQPIFTLSVYLHGMTFVLLGMFVAASAGEVLFNKEEADILMHRPITSRALLWAKIGVLVEVSLWLAGAFNLVGFFVGTRCPDGGWLFPIVHVGSTLLEALFCTGTVVLVYQLCLRWFGRERLEGLMTMAQVLIAMAVVAGGQIIPRMIGRFGVVRLGEDTWWIALLPPAWFAGFDDALAGSGHYGSWILAGAGVTITATVLWFAFGKLSRDYEAGLQALNETKATRPRRQGGRRLIDVVVNVAPLRWWLRDPVARASFLLSVAYLFRDRDVKLRVYPGLAPLLVLPLVFLFQDNGRDGGGFGVAFTGGYLGLIPMLGLNLLRYSQQWQAADLFRAVPLAGPAQLCHGARRAVLCVLTLPLLILFGLIAWLLRGHISHFPLVLPGLIALPIYALIPCLGGKAVPLSLPTDEAKSAGRGLSMIGVMAISIGLSALALFSWSGGWFKWLLLGEGVLVVGLYAAMRFAITRTHWQSME